MLTRIKIYFQLLVNQSVSKTSETTNRMIFTETKILVHFYKKLQDIIIIFHDFPWPWLFSMTFQAWKMVLLNSMTFHDFPGRVVTLLMPAVKEWGMPRAVNRHHHHYLIIGISRLLPAHTLFQFISQPPQLFLQVGNTSLQLVAQDLQRDVTLA